MNAVATIRNVTLAALTAVSIGGGLLATATPASAGPGYGHHHHHGHFHGHRYGYGGAGIIGGLAIGAIAAGAIAAQTACYDVQEPIVDRWGNVIRYRVMRVCD